jgi:hypothetical protein
VTYAAATSRRPALGLWKLVTPILAQAFPKSWTKSFSVEFHDSGHLTKICWLLCTRMFWQACRCSLLVFPFLSLKCRLQKAFYYDIAKTNAIHVTVHKGIKTYKLYHHLFLISVLGWLHTQRHRSYDVRMIHVAWSNRVYCSLTWRLLSDCRTVDVASHFGLFTIRYAASDIIWKKFGSTTEPWSVWITNTSDSTNSQLQ